jgi:precorrin-4 methylase
MFSVEVCAVVFAAMATMTTTIKTMRASQTVVLVRAVIRTTTAKTTATAAMAANLKQEECSIPTPHDSCFPGRFARMWLKNV